MAEGDVWVVRDAEGHDAAELAAQGGGWWVVRTDGDDAVVRCGPEATCLLTLDSEERAVLTLHGPGSSGALQHGGHSWTVSPITGVVSTITVSRLGVDVVTVAVDRWPYEVRQTGILPSDVVLFTCLAVSQRRPAPVVPPA
jgi:hypothetical protein